MGDFTVVSVLDVVLSEFYCFTTCAPFCEYMQAYDKRKEELDKLNDAYDLHVNSAAAKIR